MLFETNEKVETEHETIWAKRVKSHLHLNKPVSDPLWPDDLFTFEILNFAVGQIIGDDVGGF